MNQESEELAAADAALLELGFALGQSHAFCVVAGRCSAAQAEGLRRLREEKLYKRCCEKWDDFCSKYLKISRVEADRTIKLLDVIRGGTWERRLPSGRSAQSPLSHEQGFRARRACA